MLLKILLSTFILTFFSGKTQNLDSKGNKTITVVGIAENKKIGAVVLTKTHDYIVYGLPAWGNKYYHKKVKVTGILIIEEHKRQSTDSIPRQEQLGIWRIIKKAKWTLVK